MAMIFQRAMKRLLSPACALAALVVSAAVSSLEWDFAKTAEDRVFVDVKPTPSRPGVPAGAIALDIKLFEGAASVRAATFHLKIGDDWLAAAQVDTAALATSRLRVPFGNFAPTVGEEPKIDEVRMRCGARLRPVRAGSSSTLSRSPPSLRSPFCRAR